MKVMRLPRIRLPKIRLGLWLIVLITLLALYIDMPEIPVKFQIGSWKVDQTFKHPTLIIGNLTRDLEPRLGLDLQGGSHIVLEADMSQVSKDKRDEALEFTKSVIERRVNLFGVSEPVIQTSKSGDTYRVIVELAGTKDINEALKTIGQTAKLEFREMTPEPADATASAQIPFIENTIATGLNGGDIERADVVFNPNTNEPQVSFTIHKASQDKFYEKTGELLGKPMVIFLDDFPVSAPTVQAAIKDTGQITGQFTTEEAKRLALQLNAGALKAPVKVVSQRTVGATLGDDSIRKSIVAGVIGMAIIMVFMIANYGFLGIIANLALVVYVLILFAIFKIIPVTLTLAGIAGFILSIGMAVDANILIFERMKEEIHWGKERKTALNLGFERALSSIKASNFSTLITTAILYMFGTGMVRGFALTLALGVLISMFSAITVTRTFLRAIYLR